MASLITDSAMQQQDRRPSPGLNLNLPSNNPFRNPALVSPRNLSPAVSSPAFPPPPRSPRLNPATNPFLAPQEQNGIRPQPSTVGAATNGVMDEPTAGQTAQRSPQEQAEQLFKQMSLRNGSTTNIAAPPVQPAPIGLSGHKPSLSDEALRRRDPRMMRPRPRPNEQDGLDIFASPERREARRTRRNSESSVMSRSSMNEEERRRRERRRREAERGDTSKERRGSKDRDPSKPRAPRRKPRGMDLIDRLDQTGIYGAGFIHHDGPFDAVNPHRNRKKDDRAPMRAFPAGSANMMIGGSGPLNKGIDLERFHGVGAEGFTDYAQAAESKKKSMMTFDPLARVDPVYGEESTGLGTSTFLEGAPASRAQIARRESETRQDVIQGGIGRKKSLAQRFRGVGRGQEPVRPVIGARMNTGATSPGTPRVPDRLIQSAGGPSRIGEPNPFDTIYDDAFDKKGAAIKVAEQQRSEDAERAMTRGNRERAPSSPMRNQLERRVTADSAGEGNGGGFMDRVKSLKGGRRTRRPS